MSRFTQNWDESFNEMVWSMGLESASSCKTVLDSATNRNGNNAGITNQLSITMTFYFYSFYSKADATRKAQSDVFHQGRMRGTRMFLS